MTILGTVLAALKINKEPAAWIGAILIVIQIVQAVLTNVSAGQTILQAIVTVVGTIAVRQSVTPNAKITQANRRPLPPIK